MSESQSLLQRFFDASLIPADTNDERLGHYQAAAADLAKRFTEKPREAVSASRVAIDPKCPASDPWFVVVQDAVKMHWKTFLANHHDAPRQICRAILLEALSIAAGGDKDLSAAVWNATSSLLPHLGSGSEQNITREFISRLGDDCESYSSENWRIGESAKFKIPEFDIKLSPFKLAKLNESALEKGLGLASGPQDRHGQQEGHNPHWPHNNPQPWAYEFATRSASVIAAEVNKTLASVGPTLKEMSEQLEPALKKHANSLHKSVRSSVELSSRYTNLLWWRQALYSPSLRQSYRKISPVGIAVSCPFDLAEVSGGLVPVSVEFFLRETIRAVVSDNPRLTLAELIEAAKTSDPIEPCLPSPPTGPAHRVSLREFLALARQGTPPAEAVSTYVGIERSVTLTLSEWAVWLLREQLADILATTKS